MTIKLQKLAEIVERRVVVIGQRRPGDVAAILTNLQPAQDPNPESAWRMELLIGEGSAARLIKIELPPALSNSDPTESPTFLRCTNICVLYFRNKIFISDRFPMSMSERDEVVLRAKKATYDEEAELASLRASVANLEATIEFRKSSSNRRQIPEDVKLVVWARDGGSCVRCGLKQNLHFDHIIPVAKGGGSTEQNIQILCQSCNLMKSDKISI